MRAPQHRNEIIESLFRQYGNSIYRFVKFSIPKDMDPADVVQEVFVRAFRSWDEFEGRSEPQTWLFRIAQNYVFDELRKKRTERRFIVDQRAQLPSKSVSLDTILEIEDILRRLKPIDQQILNLRLIQDLSVSETARILNWSEMKVRVAFHRSKKRLQALLDEPSAVKQRQMTKGGGKFET